MSETYLIIIFIRKIFKNSGIYFVGSTDKLPEPLSKEEEVRYVELSMAGDENARNKLIEHNLRLVVFLSKKYENVEVENTGRIQKQAMNPNNYTMVKSKWL